jgi:hypothetical protein
MLSVLLVLKIVRRATPRQVALPVSQTLSEIHHLLVYVRQVIMKKILKFVENVCINVISV